jgi:HD-like signal output (HDOD) protein
MQLAEVGKKTPELLRRQAMGSVAKLPPFSAVMNKLMSTLADEDVSFGEVATVIEQDTVLAGNVLKVVNSAAYGRRGTVNSVRHAVSMLGLARVRNTAMTISVGQMWGRLDLHPQWSPKQFHMHSMAAATIADLLALELKVNYPEGAFTAGLLSGVGLLLMATALRNEYTQLGRCYELAAVSSGGSLEACETALFGFPHYELSADVLEHWGLPEAISGAVRRAGQAADSDVTQLNQLVHLSIALASQTGHPIQSWVRAPLGEPRATFAQVGLAGHAEVMLATYDVQMQAMLPFAA